MGEPLAGKVAIVTGGSRGIGEASALELARLGAKVVISARGEGQLREAAARIGPQAEPVVSDAGNLDDLRQLVEVTVDHHGSVDILVNNAGVAPAAKQIYKVTPDEWEEVMAINLRGPWYLSTLCHPHMKRRGGGAIVNISSNAGLHHDIGLGVYGISKAAVIMLTTVCAKEWARDNIRVNAIAPGIVRTELAKSVIDYIAEHGQKPNPMNLIGEPADVAQMVRFLVTDESRFVTGDVFRIDGGELL